MCDFRLWYQSGENVYVLQCVECNIFQVRLRNTAFMFNPAEYDQFRRMVNRHFLNPETISQDDAVIIDVSGTNIKLHISFSDLTELFYLLDESDTQMKTMQMINGFNEY